MTEIEGLPQRKTEAVAEIVTAIVTDYICVYCGRRFERNRIMPWHERALSDGFIITCEGTGVDPIAIEVPTKIRILR